jgi:hypothetical protein
MSSWRFDEPLVTLSTPETNERSKALWEAEDLGGLTEDNNPLPVPIVWLVGLTVVTAFALTLPLWGQRPTADLYEPLIDAMENPAVLNAADDTEAMNQVLALTANNPRSNPALLARHPVTMDDLRMIAPQVQALEVKGVDLRDYSVVGPNVVVANFEGNYRKDGTRIRQQPWWDIGYTIDLFYLTAFFLGVFITVKRLPPVSWQPRHGNH